MLKVKKLRSADCVVGGFRYATGKREVGSLLLGLYDESGLLHHVGFTSNMPDRAALTEAARSADRAAGLHRRRAGRPEPLVDRAIIAMAAACAPNWSSRFVTIMSPGAASGTAPASCAGGPDKSPRQCGFDQLEEEARPAIVEAALGIE